MHWRRWGSVWISLSLLAGCGSSSLRLAPRYVAVHNTMTAVGLAQSGDINEGSLSEGGIARTALSLRAGDCHTFVAFGDDGVRNLDVVVLDDTGTEVASDRTTDAQAAAQFCPQVDGEYQVGVRMTEGNGGYVVTSYSGGPMGGGSAGGSSRGTCSSPIPLELGTPVRGNTSSASNDMTGTCIQGGNAPEMVYALTVENRAQVSIVINSDYDGALYLLGACGEMRSEIACNDDNPNTSRSQIDATLDPGTYFLVVDGYADASGEFELLAQAQELQSLAQICGGATTITSGQAVTGSTANQAGYFTATCAGGARSPDRVYQIDVPARSRMRVRMQSTYDGAIYVRSDCDNPNSEVACNDDHRDTRHSMLVTTVDPGRYYIYADGFSQNSQGDYSLRADLAPVTGGTMAGNTCGTVGTAAAGTDLELDTFQASDDFQASCGGAGAPDGVYQFTVTSRTRLRATVADSEFPTTLYVQRTCGDQTTEVACASGGRRGSTSLDTNLQPGTYFLVVDGQGADQFGAARVEIAMDDLQALETACRSAPRIRPGRTITGDTSSSSDRFQASCAGGARSNDRIYRLQLTRRSRVRVTSEQQFDGAVYIRSDCTDISTEVACNDDSQDNRHSAVDVVLDRGTYYVFVDGFADASQGAFTMDVEVTRP
ncbi:MAG: hypothetical protein AB8I08_07680 [Sandaracinaceae bacterium]